MDHLKIIHQSEEFETDILLVHNILIFNDKNILPQYNIQVVSATKETVF